MIKDPSEILDKIPLSPGVYIFRDAHGSDLYIGKARELRRRVTSYFRLSHDDRPQIPLMLKRAEAIDWIVTESEGEALLLEANLVREKKPPYNIELRDDKHFPYVKIHLDERFPRISIARSVQLDGARYFGPFTESQSLRSVLASFRKIFMIRSCRLNLTEDRERRPCIDYSMGICSGPCNGHISDEDYSRSIDAIVNYFQGRGVELIESLKERMNSAASEFKFEEAARVRDIIASVKKLLIRQGVDLCRPDLNVDVFALYRGESYSCFTVLVVRGGVVINQQSHPYSRDRGDWDSPAKLIIDYYRKSADEAPSQAFISEEFKDDIESLQEWSQLNGTGVRFIQPLRGEKFSLVKRAEKAARLKISQNYLHNGPALLKELAHVCNLPKVPQTVEAFDISNLGSSFTVAGMVHFNGGQADKSLYRRFKIKSVSGQNDFAMMMEAVSRRLSRLESEGKPFPDLLLIDGGKGQLSSAMKALQLYKDPPMIISLAKREELVFSPYTKEAVQLGEGHPVRRLLERIRDEVHRWAITYHRALRGRSFQSSVLQEIQGIGPKKAKVLLVRFGSAEEVANQSIESLTSVPGITEEIAKRVKMELKELFS